jgi:non-ribosomal peptide synthetase component F
MLDLRSGENGEIAGSLQYDASLFSAATIEGLVAHYLCVLEAFSSGPERRIGDIDLLMPVEREQVLRGLNDTARPVPCFVLRT